MHGAEGADGGDRITQPGTFIVGTGRCGSTLMSELINLHPDLLSISELLVPLHPQAFPSEPEPGAALWHRLSAPHLALALQLRMRIEPSEILYPVDDGRRFTRSTGVPPISAITLPHLGGDPDLLFDELGSFVRSLPRAHVGVHYRSLFDWLTARQVRSRWVERSGASFAYLPSLVDAFPEARYVHLYRNGPDTALSMAASAEFRFEVLRADFLRETGFDPYSSEERPDDWSVPMHLRPFAPDTFDREHYLGTDFGVERFGALWSRLIRTGLRVLAKMDPAQVHHLSYDELLRDPARELAGLAEFLQLADAQTWVARAAGLVRQPRSSWRQTPPDVQARLVAACRPGERELVRAGLAGGFSEAVPQRDPER